MAGIGNPTTTRFGLPYKITGDEMRSRGRAMWGNGIEDGDPIDITKATEAAVDRFLAVLEAHPTARVMVPVMDYIDPSIIKAGLMYENPERNNGVSTLPRMEAQIAKAKADLASEIDNILAPQDQDIVKAMTSTNTSMMHNIADAQVSILFKQFYPVQALIQTTACKGKFAQWDAITPNGAGTAYFDGEDPELVESDITDITRMTGVKIMYSKGRLTKMAMLAGSAQEPSRDLMAIRTMASNEMIKKLRERSIVGCVRDVQSTSNDFAPATSLQYAGLYELITGYTQSTGAISNTASPSFKTATSWSGDTDPATCWRKYVEQDLNESYRRMVYYGLKPDVLVTDYRTFSFIRTALNDMFRGVDNMVQTTFGISKINLAMPNGILPIVAAPFMPNTVGAGNIFMLDTDMIERRILWPETFEELANINTSKQYVISAAECLIDKSDWASQSTLGTSDSFKSMQGGVFAIPTLV